MASLSVDAAEKGLAPLRGSRMVSIVLPLPISRSSSTSSLDSVDSFATYVTAATRFPSARNSRIVGSRPVSKVSRRSVISAAGVPKILPPKKPASRWIRFQLWFNTYRYVAPQRFAPTPIIPNCRKFFVFTVAWNAIALLSAMTGRWTYAQSHAGAFVLGNILVAILVRNELFGRLLYLMVNTFFCKVPYFLSAVNQMPNKTLFQWPPLKFRLACTSILQHLGGIHSGCATSGFFWLIYRLFYVFINHGKHYTSVLVTGVFTCISIGITIIAALPWVRNTHHKYVHLLSIGTALTLMLLSSVFERHHRFVGWSVRLLRSRGMSLILLLSGSPCSSVRFSIILNLFFGTILVAAWIFVVLGEYYDPTTQSMEPSVSRVVSQEQFWFALGMTTL